MDTLLKHLDTDNRTAYVCKCKFQSAETGIRVGNKLHNPVNGCGARSSAMGQLL
jgi:hypothetical protein